MAVKEYFLINLGSTIQIFVVKKSKFNFKIMLEGAKEGKSNASLGTKLAIIVENLDIMPETAAKTKV
jgi:hypothetical protein